jgi:hypothetical protein
VATSSPTRHTTDSKSQFSDQHGARRFSRYRRLSCLLIVALSRILGRVDRGACSGGGHRNDCRAARHSADLSARRSALQPTLDLRHRPHHRGYDPHHLGTAGIAAGGAGHPQFPGQRTILLRDRVSFVCGGNHGRCGDRPLPDAALHAARHSHPGRNQRSGDYLGARRQHSGSEPIVPE